MYDPDSDTPAMARTSNLNEELGQVRSCVILFLLPLFFFTVLRVSFIRNSLYVCVVKLVLVL